MLQPGRGEKPIRCRNPECPAKVATLRTVDGQKKLTIRDGVKPTVLQDGDVEMVCPRCGWRSTFVWPKRDAA